MAPSKTSRTEVAAAPASVTPLIKVFRRGRVVGVTKLAVAEIGIDFAIVFINLIVALFLPCKPPFWAYPQPHP